MRLSLTRCNATSTIPFTMKPKERQNQILELLRAYQTELKVEEIAEVFDVSPLTIRRDLDALSENKTIIRTHGGCLTAGRIALQTEYHKKVAKNFRFKKAIATAAMRFLSKGDVILLNDGTTTFHVGLQIGAFGNCTIYTNSLAMIAEYNLFNDVRLFLLPGEYDDERYSIRGGLTEHVLENLKFDIVFLGTDAIDDEGRCLVETPAEARLAYLMLRSGKQKILVADYTKVGANGHVTYGRLSDFDSWIVSGDVAEERIETYSRLTNIIEAEVPDDDG